MTYKHTQPKLTRRERRAQLAKLPAAQRYGDYHWRSQIGWW